MKMEIEPLSLRTLKRLVHVADVRPTSVRSDKSLMTPTSEVVEESPEGNDQLVDVENKSEHVDKEVDVKDADLHGESKKHPRLLSAVAFSNTVRF